MIAALLLAGVSAVLEPTPLAARTVLMDDQGAIWAVVDCPLPATSGPLTLAWPTAEPGIDLSSARVLGFQPQGVATVTQRRETGEAVEWKLSIASTAEKACVRLAARLPELRLEWQHLVAVSGDGAEWVLAAVVSGWKGAPAENVLLVTPFGRCEGLSLQPEVTQTILLWSTRDVRVRGLLRWDSRDGREAASRLLVFDRDLTSEFGRRTLPAGKVTIQVETRRTVQDFGGAMPGSPVELRVGDAPGVLVKRVKASSTQVDVRTDANRRLAAFTEKLEYEYAISNALAEPVELELVEHPARGWEVAQASVQWRKRDSDTLVFTVSLEARSQTKVTATLLRRNQTPA